MDADAVIQRLTDPTAPHAQRLAELIVEDALGSTLEQLVPLERALDVTLRGVEAYLATDASLVPLERGVKRLIADLDAEKASIRDTVPDELIALAKKWLMRPWSPDRSVVLAALDEPPVRALIRKLLIDSTMEFSRTVSAPVSGVARGLGGLAKFAAERTGTLGAIAGAVGSEAQRMVEKRASDFADTALSGVLQKIADEFSNPARAKEQAELRAAVLEGLLNLRGPQLAREVGRSDPLGGAKIVRDGLKAWLATPDAKSQLRGILQHIVAPEWQRTVREMLAELGLLEFAKTEATVLLERRIRAFAATEGFKAFAAALLS
ncbi:MAG: hypothetical protein ACJ790_02865 [Myxococcaceae bacterium]